MKLNLLPDGAKFRYQGYDYQKRTGTDVVCLSDDGTEFSERENEEILSEDPFTGGEEVQMIVD